MKKWIFLHLRKRGAHYCVFKTSVDKQLKALLKEAVETGSKEPVNLVRFCTTFPESAIMMAEKVNRAAEEVSVESLNIIV